MVLRLTTLLSPVNINFYAVASYVIILLALVCLHFVVIIKTHEASNMQSLSKLFICNTALLLLAKALGISCHTDLCNGGNRSHHSYVAISHVHVRHYRFHGTHQFMCPCLTNQMIIVRYKLATSSTLNTCDTHVARISHAQKSCVYTCLHTWTRV